MLDGAHSACDLEYKIDTALSFRLPAIALVLEAFVSLQIHFQILLHLVSSDHE